VRIHKDLLEEAIRYATAYEWPASDTFPDGVPPIGITARWGYSGRGMMGATCFGIVTGVGGLTAFVAALEVVLTEADERRGTDPTDGEAISWWDLLPLMTRDDMGLQEIYYFPGLTVEE
jgi:hypothetical protein